MKAATLIVLILTLTSALSAQTTDSVANVPPRILRTAGLIGVRSQVEELMQLHATPEQNEMKEFRLIQRLQGVVIASALDVDSVNARIDYETAHLQEVQAYLELVPPVVET